MKKFLITLLVLVLLAAIGFGLYYFLWTPENLATLGEDALEDGKYDRAVFFFRHAAEMDTDEPSYVLSLADACIADGSYTQAERSLVEFIRKAPSAALYTKLSSVYVAQDKLFDAQKMLDSITDSAVRAEIDAVRPAAPVFTPAAGEYDERIALSFESDSAVYYSLTHEYPTTASHAFSEAITLEAGQTHVSAIAVGENGLVSPLAEADYLIVGVVEEVSFSSAELESYIRELLYISRTEPVMSDLLWTVTELTVPADVLDYSDLRYFTGLTSLTVHDSAVTDYSFLSELTELQTLDLTGSLVSADTLALIGALPLLSELHLSGCGLSNIQPLSANTALTVLDLSENSISNLSPLAGCTALTELNLAGNAVDSLTALEKLTELKTLDITGNAVSSLVPLAKCDELQTLRAEDNKLSDLSVLAGMTDLRVFTASRNAISDLSALASCTKLERLELASNALTSVDVIASMPNLTYLDIARNQVAKLPALAPTARLQQFYASYNALESVEALAGLAELAYVDVDYNEKLEDIECLSTCPILVQVNAFGTKVKEVKALTDQSIIVNYDPTAAVDNKDD